MLDVSPDPDLDLSFLFDISPMLPFAHTVEVEIVRFKPELQSEYKTYFGGSAMTYEEGKSDDNASAGLRASNRGAPHTKSEGYPRGKPGPRTRKRPHFTYITESSSDDDDESTNVQNIPADLASRIKLARRSCVTKVLPH